MVLVNEAQGYRVCLECHEVFDGGDEHVWMARHVQPECGSRRRSSERPARHSADRYPGRPGDDTTLGDARRVQ